MITPPIPIHRLVRLSLLAALLTLVLLTISLPLRRRIESFLANQPLARAASGKNATTDSYLAALDIPHPSEAVQTAVTQLPSDDALLFIAPDQRPETELLYRVIATLSWPHEIGVLHCDSRALLFQPRAGKKIRWLLLYRLEPPIGSNPVAISPHLKLLPITETTEWMSYCSQ